MTRIAILLSFLFSTASALPALAAPKPSSKKELRINIVYPPEGHQLPAVKAQFILGSVSHPRGSLTINGQTVTIHKKGGFLAWVPVETGTFTFRCSLKVGKATATAERQVTVKERSLPLPASPLQIDQDSIRPRKDLVLRAGDSLSVSLRASPGATAQFRFGRTVWLPMSETPPSSGHYEAAYAIGPEDKTSSAPVEVRLGHKWKGPKLLSAGRVSIDHGTPRVLTVKDDARVSVKTGPGKGYFLFPQEGTLFTSAGRRGSEIKVRLSKDRTGWIDQRYIKWLPEGTPPPLAIARTISTGAGKDSTLLRVRLSKNVPFLIETHPERSEITVRLFSTIAHINWVVYDKNDSFIKEVRWEQESDDVVVIRAFLDPREPLWGVHARFDAGSLKIDVRRPPTFARKGSVLAGRRIFLDPGHMPSVPGFTGPRGTREMDVNFAIAKATERLLLTEGAHPIMSRGKNEEVSLTARTKAAWKKRADVFVSLHNNALPDGANPFKWPHGYSVFYYHPQSHALAKDIYAAFKKRLRLPGENVRYGNLFVIRMTEMPAVLIESAYMLFPEQEYLLTTPAFQNKIARSVVEGLRANWERIRRSQKHRPAPKRARKRPSRTKRPKKTKTKDKTP